jgi:hypothetical protein
MPAPRNDEKANAMYSLYQEGHSLSQVGKAFSTSRQGVFKMFAKRGFAMRTVEPLPFIIWNGMKYTPREHGYYARTKAGRKYLHRDVWEFHNGPIPPNHDVHHVDEDKSHNSISNLKLLHVSDHGKLHSMTNEGFKKTQFKLGHVGAHHPRKSQ